MVEGPPKQGNKNQPGKTRTRPGNTAETRGKWAPKGNLAKVTCDMVAMVHFLRPFPPLA